MLTLDGGAHFTKRLVKIFARMNILYELKPIVRNYKKPELFTANGCGSLRTVELTASDDEPRNSVYRLMQGLQELFPKVGFEIFFRSI